MSGAGVRTPPPAPPRRRQLGYARGVTRRPPPSAPPALTAATDAHHAAMDACRDLLARARALLPLVRRERHDTDRAVTRPDARPPRRERARCGARTRAGRACAAPVWWPPGAEHPRTRCRLHGGASTGPRTVEGQRRSLAAIGRVPRLDALPRTPEGRPLLLPREDCPLCTARARQHRTTVRAILAAPGLDAASRLVRATRCPEHAAPELAALARSAGPTTVRVTLPHA